MTHPACAGQNIPHNGPCGGLRGGFRAKGASQMDDGYDGGGSHMGMSGGVLSCSRNVHGVCAVPEAPPTQKDALRPPDSADPVRRPSHYTRLSPEPIDVIRGWDLNFCRGNAVKYLARAGYKGDEVEDLRKAMEYIRLEIERMEGA